MKEWAVFFILRQLLLRDGKFSPAWKARKTSEVISRLEPRITSLSICSQVAEKNAGKKGLERVISSEAASSAGGSLRLARITLQHSTSGRKVILCSEGGEVKLFSPGGR